MASAMVTGRMTPEKKRSGARVLEGLGLTASQAINQLYDYLIRTGQMPFGEDTRPAITAEDRRRAQSFISSMQRRNRFSNMSDAEIKRTKMKQRGYSAEGER